MPMEKEIHTLVQPLGAMRPFLGGEMAFHPEWSAAVSHSRDACPKYFSNSPLTLLCMFSAQ